MTDDNNCTNKVLDSRFSSRISNSPTITGRFSKELIQHRDEMNKIKFMGFSAYEKVKAFKKVYEKIDKSKYYSISSDSIIKLMSDELSSASELSV